MLLVLLLLLLLKLLLLKLLLQKLKLLMLLPERRASLVVLGEAAIQAQLPADSAEHEVSCRWSISEHQNLPNTEVH